MPLIERVLTAVTAQNDHLGKRVESSAFMAWSVGPRMTRIENTQATIKSDIASLKTDTVEIKAMMIAMFCDFREQSFSTPSSKQPDDPSHTTPKDNRGKGIARDTD
ncbi:hypothetical protein Tco_0930148 [Tanacetum coccineum]